MQGEKYYNHYVCSHCRYLIPQSQESVPIFHIFLN